MESANSNFAKSPIYAPRDSEKSFEGFTRIAIDFNVQRKLDRLVQGTREQYTYF